MPFVSKKMTFKGEKYENNPFFVDPKCVMKT